MADKKLKITLVKSTIGAVPKNKAIVESMGLRKIGKSVVLQIMMQQEDRSVR